MTTSFSTLPIVDLSVLSSPRVSAAELASLSKQLHDVFATTGFAYLINAPLSFTHDDVFGLAADFFAMRDEDKMDVAKKTFARHHTNTYRGYFPTQPGRQHDNLKEGFEMGPPRPDTASDSACSAAPRSSSSSSSSSARRKFDLAEPNVWPAPASFPRGRERMEALHGELQRLASTLLSLVALSLGRPADFFSDYLADSLSTLRLLHYPPRPAAPAPAQDVGLSSSSSSSPAVSDADVSTDVKLCCTPHTDSGILTLLHQDRTGGLEVLNAGGEWVPAPHVAGSLVVNIGDLLADVSGGRFVATMHRVRAATGPKTEGGDISNTGSSDDRGLGRLSVPFFFEPGERCVVRPVDRDGGGGGGDGVVYGEHVRRKMGMWVEFQDVVDPSGGRAMDDVGGSGGAVAAAAVAA